MQLRLQLRNRNLYANEPLGSKFTYQDTIFYFRYHRQFIEAASDRYTSGERGDKLHRDLANLYLAESGVKRDITLTYRRNMLVKNADRQVTLQPMTVKNKRMLTALPWHLTRYIAFSTE